MSSSGPEPAAYVVIIDDTPDDVALFEWHLKRLGFRVEIIPFASSAEAADFFVRFATSGFPWPVHTTVFCDVKMPGLSGFEVLKQIRSCPPLATIPVYMVSDANDPADRQRLMALGATGYLAKFPSPYELSSILAPGASSSRGAPVA